MLNVRLRLRELFRVKHFEREMDDELRFHLDSVIRKNIQAGMTFEEAQRAARLEFGGIEQIKEDCRDTLWTQWLDEFMHDVNYALRHLWKNPLFTATAVFLIAAMIGLLCAAYAILDAVVLRTLPMPSPEQLVVINSRAQIDSSIFDVLERERQNITQIFGLKSGVLYGSTGGLTRSLLIYGFRGDYFGAVGAAPQLGRFLTADEHDSVAIISDRCWRREFGAAPDILGRSIQLGSLNPTVVGVAGPDFVPVEEPYSEWDAIVPSDIFCRAFGIKRMPLQIVARLKSGKKPAEYEAQLNSLWPAILQSTVPPKTTLKEWRNAIGSRAEVESISHGINYILVMQPSIQLAIQMVFGLSILIFLSGCLALVLLTIARNIKGQRETAIKLAIGAGRWRVQRPFLLETLIISGLGCSIGLLTAWGWSGLATSFLPASQFINWRVRIDGHVLMLASVVTLFIVVLTSSMTALSGFRGKTNLLLNSGDPVSRPTVRVRMSLLALQLAISVLSVHYALFFSAALSKMLNVPIGFEPEHLHVYRLSSKPPRRDTPAGYFPMLISKIEQMPGVESATLSMGPPPVSFPREYKQPVKTDDGQEIQATVIPVSPGYLRTLHLPLLWGRDFSWKDQNVAVINETLMKKLNFGQRSLGHKISFGETGTPLQIIGVTGKMAYFGPRWGDSTIALVLYNPLTRGNISIMVRSKQNLDELRKPVQTVLDSPGLHYISESVDASSLLSSSMQEERMLATIAGAFGVLIVIVAGLELYAFCVYLLGMRGKELAIRASVGAGPVQIASTLLREVIKALGIGLTLGSIGFLAGGRFLANSLGTRNAPGPYYLALAIVMIASVTLSAVLMPTLRAIRIDIARSLRVD